MPIKVTAETFEAEVLQSKTPVLVDFWAPRCLPCRMLAPLLEELAEELGDQIKICKADADEELTLALQYGVMALPTLMLFRDGKAADTTVGLPTKEELLEFLALGEIPAAEVKPAPASVAEFD
ncbi:MAG: thioredoxin [Oscillospiraceae bacterium]|jgi:thioredoxin 1|nr:thioredoxin [Oscillospiraceae bacterium]